LRSKYLKNRFNTTKEELKRLGAEFSSQALPCLENLYNCTYWILLNKESTDKIIKQVFFEAIEDCDITKNDADWPSWIQRIWIREILEFYEDKENDRNTDFSFIENFEPDISNSKTLFTTETTLEKIVDSIKKLPAVLRIPLMMRESTQLNYEKISDLIDTPFGVAATRIFRARKLLFMNLQNELNFNEIKSLSIEKNFTKLIFKLRDCSSIIDNEFTESQKANFLASVKDDQRLNTELLVQREVKNLLTSIVERKSDIKAIMAEINKKASKRFINR
jgi:DNA-directed RNA polymerase specialized sigma24 family protein